VIALEAFLSEHDAHFTVLVKGHSLLGYLNAVLSDQDVNTCNNEVATQMATALDKQFGQVSPYVQVGLRLLRVGFFHTAQDLSVPVELDADEYTGMASTIKKAVAAFAADTFDVEQVTTFVALGDRIDYLIKEGYLKGMGIKKQLKELFNYVTMLSADLSDETLRIAVRGEAERIQFLG
jgi:prolyl oligopeptidase PreP (S9A serine peptidase family)